MSNQSALNDSLNKLSELSSSGEVARINRSKRSSRHKSESAKSLLGNLLDDSIATADAEREREEERKRRGMTQQQLAGELGVSRQTIISLESGRYNPSILLAHRIAQLFDAKIEDIFLFDTEEEA